MLFRSTLVGNKCYDIKSGTPKYTCPQGNLTETNKCVAQVKATAKINYSCLSGYRLNGDICVPNVGTISINATLNTNSYCPSGYSPYNSTLCSMYTSGYYTNVTEYRYRTRTYVNGKEVEKWSTSDKDADLIKQGYKYTGVYRELVEKA